MSNWLVDEFNVDLTVGSVGEVSDEGRRRHVHVDAFSPLERLAFTWWDDHEGSVASQVEIDVEGCADGTSTLRITETLLASAHHSRTPTDDTTLEASAATLAWEVRMVSLWACTVAMALVQ